MSQIPLCRLLRKLLIAAAVVFSQVAVAQPYSISGNVTGAVSGGVTITLSGDSSASVMTGGGDCTKRQLD